MQTAASATVGEHLASSTLSSVEASGVKTALCASRKITKQKVVMSAQTRNQHQCNPSSQSSPICMPIQQCAATVANEPLNSSACRLDHVQRQVEVRESPPQHLKPGGSCDNLPVASPRRSLTMHTETATESQGECSLTVEEHLHPYPASKTTGTLFESSPPAPSSIPIGAATTLVVRNIPAKYSAEMLLQEFPPDGSYDFFYLPYSFQKMTVAGYLFINFISSAEASAFYSQWHGRPLCRQGSSAKLNIGVADVQGLEENVCQLIKRNIKRIKNPKFLPSVFDGLQEVPFSEFVSQLGRSSSAEHQ